jgi:hypothetical protein
MIIYDKSLWGIGLLVRIYGSAFPRTLPSAFITILFSLLLIYFEADVESWWKHPYPYGTFSFAVGFIIVFR